MCGQLVNRRERVTAVGQKLYTLDRVTRIYTPHFRYVTLILKYTARGARRYAKFTM